MFRQLRTGLLILPIAMHACVWVGNDGNATGPDGDSDLSVTGSTLTPDVFEGATVTLTAEAGGGAPPYLFRWDQNAGPEELTLSAPTSDTLSVEPLTAPGRYVFRISATDSEGHHATDFVTVEVLSAVSVEAPKLAVVGEPLELTATIETQLGDVRLSWEVVRGNASLDEATSANPTLTTTAGETVEVLLTATLSPDGAAPAATTRSLEIVSIYNLHPQVLVETNHGGFTIELDGEAAPLHTANFLLYVDDGFYDGLLFHRNARSENLDTGECERCVLQGGGFRRIGNEIDLQDATRNPVRSEAGNGLTNGTVYSVAMALSGGDPDSGTTQFFVNLSDNSFLDDLGFTVFGMVVDGIGVVDAIAAAEAISSPVIPGEASFPVEDVIIERIGRVSP